MSFKFEKADSRGKYVRGYAYLVKDRNGADVVDYSGQFIDDFEVLREAAHDFMERRIAKSMHGKGGVLDQDGEPVGDIVESLLVDDDVAKALSITDKRRGWFIGMRVNDPVIQKSIRDGKLREFSIGGRGRVEKLAA